MTERERLLEKLMKVKALADRGEGGERRAHPGRYDGAVRNFQC